LIKVPVIFNDVLGTEQLEQNPTIGPVTSHHINYHLVRRTLTVAGRCIRLFAAHKPVIPLITHVLFESGIHAEVQWLQKMCAFGRDKNCFHVHLSEKRLEWCRLMRPVPVAK
jgi:hypothetical protein